MGDGQPSWGLLMVAGGFELGGRDDAQLSVEPPLVEPVDPFQGVVLHVVEVAPGTSPSLCQPRLWALQGGFNGSLQEDR